MCTNSIGSLNQSEFHIIVCPLSEHREYTGKCNSLQYNWGVRKIGLRYIKNVEKNTNQ